VERYWVTHCEWHSNLKEYSAEDGRDVEVVLAADAQATIAALQKEIATRDSTDSILATRIRELESCLTHRTEEREALQARVNGLEKDSELLRQSRDDFRVKYESVKNDAITLQSQLTQCTAERDTARRRVDELEAREVDVVTLREDLEQRTAELEAIEKILDIDSGKTTVEKVRDLHHSFKQVWESYQDASNEMFKAQAELERVSLLSSHNERRFEEVDKKYKELRTLILTLPKVEGEIVAQAGYVKDRKKVYACFGSDADMTAYAALLTHRQGMEG
jgi:uncharacterized coiled-coil DUF342 family protein